MVEGEERELRRKGRSLLNKMLRDRDVSNIFAQYLSYSLQWYGGVA